MKKTLIVAGALALLTSACGRMADLESPVRETERAPRSSRAPGLPEPATLEVDVPKGQQLNDLFAALTAAAPRLALDALPLDFDPHDAYGACDATE